MTGRDSDPSSKGWLIHPTTLLKKKRKRTFLSILLYPPGGFTGRTRFGVIDGTRRDEVTATWQNGINLSVPRSLRETKVPLYNLRPDLAWPTTLTAGLDQDNPSDPVNIHIILEQFSIESSQPISTQPSTSSVTVQPTITRAKIFILPLLPLLPTNDQRAANLLKASLEAADKDSRIRLGVPLYYLSLIKSAGLRSQLRDLQSTGQLDLLAQYSPADPAAFHSGMLPPRINISLERSSGRSDNINNSNQHLSEIENQPLVSFHLANQMEGEERPLWLPINPEVTCSPLNEDLTPFITEKFDRIIRSAATHRIAAHLDVPLDDGRRNKPRPEASLLGFFPFFLDHPDQWSRLGKQIARWNRTYLSPKLIAATPSDLLSLRDALPS